jgi:hypothetical protein
MTIKFYLIIAAVSIILSSCLKQSIPDAMLNKPDGQNQTATLRYEINGKLVLISVRDSENGAGGFRTLECVKAGGYVLSGVSSSGDFVFTFYADSLQVGNYKYLSSYGPSYVTTFEGRPQYVYGPADNMNFNVTTYKDGRISGNFTGQLTPAISQGNPNNVYGTPGSVVIRNGSFTNIPVIY